MKAYNVSGLRTVNFEQQTAFTTQNDKTMKKYVAIFIGMLLLNGCTWFEEDDHEFDYNLKSAKVISTGNSSK